MYQTPFGLSAINSSSNARTATLHKYIFQGAEMDCDLYEFRYDARARFLRLKLSGLWNEVVLRSFIADVRALRVSVERAGHRNENGRILIDLTDYAIQPKEITKGIAQILPSFGDRTGRVAVVRSNSMIQQMQMQRLIGSEKVRFFSSSDEALEWLS